MVTLYEDEEDKSTLSSASSHTSSRPSTQPPPDYREATADPGSTPPPSSSDSGRSSSSAPPPPPPPPPSAAPMQAPFIPLTPPTNYLSIKRFNSPINGTYTIDPALPVPPGSSKPRNEDGEYVNLLLSTWNGSITTFIDLVPNDNPDGPTRFEATTTNGKVEVTVADRGKKRFRLRAATLNGRLIVHLPPTFNGIVHSKLLNGQTEFTWEVQRRLTPLSDGPYERRYFIGDVPAHGYRDDRSGQIDHLYLDSKNGDAHISFSDGSVPRVPRDSEAGGRAEGRGSRGGFVDVDLGFFRFRF